MTEIDPINFRGVPLRRLQFIGLCIGAVWIICCAAGWIFEPAVFYRCYLTAWLFWLGVTLGAMSIVMLHHLLGGNWGIVIRRFGEHAAMTLPLMIILYIPILIGVHSLYIWAQPDAVAHDAILRHKTALLNIPFFFGRAVVYFAVWLLLAWYLRSRSLQHDKTASWITVRRLHNVSAGGMLFWTITMSLASLDWLMSREPDWYSTIFGWMIVCGQAISGLCVLIIIFALLYRTPPFRDIAKPDHFNDLGNLLLTTVIVWTYMAFVQLLITWMGNKQDEIPWYVQRLSGGWWYIGVGLVLFHFFVPFIILLMRDLKRKAPVMLGLCIGLLMLRAVDMFWMVAPSGQDPHPHLAHILSWMDFVFPIGMGGLWLTMFLWLMRGYPLMPLGQADPMPDVAAHRA